MVKFNSAIKRFQLKEKVSTHTHTHTHTHTSKYIYIYESQQPDRVKEKNIRVNQYPVL